MAYSESLAQRIRQALASQPQVEEKKMFGSLGFMVNGKLCVTAGPGRMMCRIDPELHEQAVSREGCQTVIMKGREYKGYVHVSEECLPHQEDLMYWVGLALDYNRKSTHS